MNDLLDRVFDEFGLIVCGWSAEWDLALVDALNRGKSRRFTTYWTARSGLSQQANDLIQFRRAEVVNIDDADTFFNNLADKVRTLEEFDRPHPLSAKMAIVMVKRLLPEERHRIRLHDLVVDETNTTLANLKQSVFSANLLQSEEGGVSLYLDRTEAVTEVLAAIVGVGCFWGKDGQAGDWAETIQRCLRLASGLDGQTISTHLRLYPGLALIYAGGIASLASGKYSTLGMLLSRPSIRLQRTSMKLLEYLYPEQIVARRPEWEGEVLPGTKAAVSTRLLNYLRPTFSSLIPDDAEFIRWFDRFEYLYLLAYASQRGNDEGHIRAAARLRPFVLRNPDRHASSVRTWVDNELAKAGEDWGPLKVGLFAGSMDDLKTVKEKVDEVLVRIAESCW